MEGQVRQIVMRDKYVELLEGAKAASAVEIEDADLKKAYEAVNAQPTAGEPSAEQPAQQ